MPPDASTAIQGLASNILSAADEMQRKIATGDNTALTRAPSLKGFAANDDNDGWWTYEVIVPWKTDTGVSKGTWVAVYSDYALTPEELQDVAEDTALDIVNAYPERFGLDPNNMPGIFSFDDITVLNLYHK